MGIPISEDTKIYIVAPANFATGGPELLHQLGYNLINELNFKNVFMYYLPPNHPNPVHNEYVDYNVPYVREIEDSEKNILIVPEVYTHLIYKFKNIRKVIWWLSVDNYYFSLSVIKRRINLLLLNRFALQRYLFFNNNLKNIDFHLVQSEYARSHIISKGIDESRIYYLSDYLNENFLKTKTDKRKKENIVAYNPKKGYKFTKKIIDYVQKRDNNIKFVPIQNMTRNEVIKLLQKAKVYIDFGHFPGKDRLPREAVILECCIITGKMGASKFYKDVPIPDKYKFENKIKNLGEIYKTISDCINNYNENIKNFENYKKIILNEENKFKNDLKNIFIKYDAKK